MPLLCAFAAPIQLSLVPNSFAPTNSLFHPHHARLPQHRRAPPAAPCSGPPRRRHRRPSRSPSMSAGGAEGPPVENLVIIGSGPAGYTAALYAARANLKPVVLEGVKSGPPGGQLMTTSDVDNFPGFPDGISGPDLMDAMRQQALRWGAELHPEDAVILDLDTAPFTVSTSERCLRAHAVVVATGASARRLAIPGEHALWGRGVSACAVCDGAAPIFAAQHVAVVGGGDSACEEAVYLTRYVAHVHLIVRRPALSASRVVAERAEKHPSVTIHFNTTVVRAVAAPPDDVDARGGSPLQAVELRHAGAGEENAQDGDAATEAASATTTMLPVRGLFYAIGHSPNTALLRDASRVRLDDAGYVLTVDGGPRTGQDGVFAAGDVADREWRQAVTAAASGCKAALAAERFLTERGLGVQYPQYDQQQQSSTNAAASSIANGNGNGAVAQAAAAAGAGSSAATNGVTGGNGLAAAAEADQEATSAVETRESAEEREVEARGSDDESTYDAEATWHSGQFALRRLYHESRRPLIVKYVSPGCGPCRQLKPMLHAVIRALEGRVHYVEIDITRDVEIAESAGVTGSPTVQVFHEKSLVKELRGVRMKSEYRRVVDDVLADIDAAKARATKSRRRPVVRDSSPPSTPAGGTRASPPPTSAAAAAAAKKAADAETTNKGRM